MMYVVVVIFCMHAWKETYETVNNRCLGKMVFYLLPSQTCFFLSPSMLPAEGVAVSDLGLESVGSLR